MLQDHVCSKLDAEPGVEKGPLDRHRVFPREQAAQDGAKRKAQQGSDVLRAKAPL